MGLVIFQFHTSFAVSEANQRRVEQCRAQLPPGVDMGVEFRNRAWFHTPAAASALASWLVPLDIVLIAADELKHETAQRDREQSGLPPGSVRELMSIALLVTAPKAFYVRLHRRCVIPTLNHASSG